MPHKTCEKCGTSNGVRSYNCKECDAPFLVRKNVKKKKKKRNGEKVNWRELVAGDYIKVLATGGPYYELDSGERVPMSYSGYFKVMGIDGKGVICRKADNKHSGTYHIYMGNPAVYKTGTMMISHRIRKVQHEYVREITV